LQIDCSQLLKKRATKKKLRKARAARQSAILKVCGLVPSAWVVSLIVIALTMPAEASCCSQGHFQEGPEV
jgi:hypothetical protein